MILAVLQSSVILIIALGAAGILRTQSAALRHLILTTGLFAAIVVPFVSRFVPERAAAHRLYDEIQKQTDVVLVVSTAAKAAAPRIVPATRQYSVPFIIWISGASIMIAVILTGLLRIAWLVRRSVPLAASAPEESFHMKRRVRFLQNPHSVLGTWGFIRPCVLIPGDSEKWSGDRLRTVLTHELAHIKRFDWPIQMIAEIVRAFYWFNPLFWFLCRRLRAESEHACDDAVLNTGISANDYATHLLELARALRDSPKAWSPVLAMARPPHLERRFVAMLNPSVNRTPVSRRIALIAGIMALLITLPLAAVRAGQQSKPAAVSEIVAVVKPAEATAPALAPAVKKAAPRVKPVQGLADGSVSGTVSDATGAVIPGVTVTVSSKTINQDLETETDVQTTVTGLVGSYEFRGLTPGQYIMKARLPGFALFRSGTFQITSGQNVVENATLSIGSIVQRVELKVAGQAKPRSVSTAGPVRIRVGGNVVAARLMSQVKPVYPAEAKEAGIEGTVHVQGIIGTDGTVSSLYATNNIRYLSNAAIDAVSQWRYSPSLLNNEPVQVPTSIDIEFKLEQ